VVWRIFRRGAAPRRRVEPPTAAELAWVRDRLETARHIAERYAHAPRDARPRAAVLDEAFATWLGGWLAQRPDAREDPAPVAEALGVAFGQELVDELAFDWVVVTEAGASRIGVCARPGELVVFPTEIVAERVEAAETRFFVPLRAELEAQVRALRGGR
jgi:hypothetical protein